MAVANNIDKMIPNIIEMNDMHKTLFRIITLSNPQTCLMNSTNEISK